MQYMDVVNRLEHAGLVPLADETVTQRICDYWVHVEKQLFCSLVVYPDGTTHVREMQFPSDDDLKALTVYQYSAAGFETHEACALTEQRFSDLFAHKNAQHEQGDVGEEGTQKAA